MVSCHDCDNAQVTSLSLPIVIHQNSLTNSDFSSYSATDWFCFMVLDIGNPEIETVPLGTRFIIGLLQAIAVRAAGFGTVSLSSLSPAVKYA